MKLCRFEHEGFLRVGIYGPERILPIDDLAAASGEKQIAEAVHDGLLDRLLPIDSAAWCATRSLVAEIDQNSAMWHTALPTRDVRLLPPLARPNKLLMLAGNYAAHVREQGDIAAERGHTFPYVFMKPPSTTLVGHQHPFRLPSNNADKLDHEVELAIVIGRTARDVTASQAAEFIAGYTIVNDISDRGFHPNVNRTERPKDKFFDWLHGKWHDGSCPCGPCLVTHDEIVDPQQLRLTLSVDGEIRQDGSTAEQVFSIYEVIEFISSWMTLQPGDIISTGTPSGVGNASGKYLRAGQCMVASIDGIGELETTVVG